MEFLDVFSNSMENKIYVEFLGSRRNNTLYNSVLLVCDQDTTLARVKLLKLPSSERGCVHTTYILFKYTIVIHRQILLIHNYKIFAKKSIYSKEIIVLLARHYVYFNMILFFLSERRHQNKTSYFP